MMATISLTSDEYCSCCSRIITSSAVHPAKSSTPDTDAVAASAPHQRRLSAPMLTANENRRGAQEALDVLPFYQVRQTLNLGLYGADFVIGPVQLGVEIVDVMGQHLDHVVVEFVG
jgi:hypothetical protein